MAASQRSDTCRQSIEDRLHATKDGRSPVELDPQFFLPTRVPLVPAAEVYILEDLHFQKVVKVEWIHKLCVFKTAFRGEEIALQREIRTLQKVQDARLFDPDLRIPRLLGLASSRGNVIGFLEEFIAHGYPLDKVDILKISYVDRAEWARQIRETLRALRQMEISWGDAKAGNVLIDGHQDAWLVDFGGSCTDGWVTAEDKETKAGDLQAYQKIERFLRISGPGFHPSRAVTS